MRWLALALIASTVVEAANVRKLHESAEMLSPPYPCILEDGVDYVGNDITNRQAPLSDCCRHCWNTDGCRAWSWTAYNGGTCWLKRAKSATIWNPNVKSGIAPKGSDSSCSMDYGVDYVGNDIANKHGESADACCEICHNHPGCKAFSWNSHNGGTCWLKSGKTETVNRPSVISSVVKRGCDITHKVDFVNYDIGNALGGHADDCCAKCLAYPNCNAFSWSDYRGGTCWFKSKKGDVVANDDVTSGVVQ